MLQAPETAGGGGAYVSPMIPDLTPPLSLDLSRYASAKQPRHTDSLLQISLVLRGHLEERVGRVTEHAGPLSLVVKRPGVEHANEYGPDGVLILRVGVRPDCIAGLVDDGARLPEWCWWHASLPFEPMLRLLHRANQQSVPLRQDDAEVADLLATLTGRAHVAPTGTPPGWLERVREQLADEAGGVRVSEIARAAGVHPVHLARCFRRWYGCSVSEHLAHLRLRRATELLARPRDTLSRIAHGAGFSDEAHFGNRFRKATGLSPGRFRALVRAADRLGVERLTTAA